MDLNFNKRFASAQFHDFEDFSEIYRSNSGKTSFPLVGLSGNQSWLFLLYVLCVCMLSPTFSTLAIGAVHKARFKFDKKWYVLKERNMAELGSIKVGVVSYSSSLHTNKHTYTHDSIHMI